MDLFDGSTWTEVARLDGNVDAENVWHQPYVQIPADHLVDNFQFRFRAKMSKSDEDANVDNVQLVGTSLAGPANNVPVGCRTIRLRPMRNVPDRHASACWRNDIRWRLAIRSRSASLTNAVQRFGWRSTVTARHLHAQRQLPRHRQLHLPGLRWSDYSDPATVTITVDPVNDARWQWMMRQPRRRTRRRRSGAGQRLRCGRTTR